MDEEEPRERLQFDVLKYVRTTQALYGLKHGDYVRYRKHCSSRLSRLRCHLKFHHGRHRFQKKELKLEMVTDARWLELMLLESERAWACAQELKAAIAADGFVHTNRRRHMLRRFAKSRKLAHTFAMACQHCGDDRTAAEAIVYLDSASATELFEKESDAMSCAAFLLRAQRALTVLAACGSVDSRSAARALATSTDSLLRLTIHRASAEKGSPVDLNAVPLPVDNDFEPRLERTQAAAAPAPAASPRDGDAAAAVETFLWRTEVFPVEEAAVQVQLGAAVAALARASAATGGAAPEADAMQARMTDCDAALKALKEARSALETAAAAGAGAGVGGGVEEEQGQALLAAVTAAMAETRMQRFVAQALLMLVKFKRAAVQTEASGKSKERGVRPNDGIRLFDGLHRAALDLESVTTLPGMPAAMVQAIVAASSASGVLFSAARCLFVAHAVLTRGEASAAAGLFSAAGERLEEARGLLAAHAGGGGLQGLLLERLASDAIAYTVVALADAAAVAEAEEGCVSSGLQAMAISGTSKAPPQGGEFLEDGLASWESYVTMPGCKPRLFNFSSLLQQIPMRPVTLDTAEQFLEEPDVSHRRPAREEESSGVVQGFRNLFGFK